jgi:uncharacterized protein (DUF1697 family)
LRAINVGGRTVRMTQLRALFEELGCAEVETFIASGNVIFTRSANNIAALERQFERHLHRALGYEVRTFLRTQSELAAIARYQPFPLAALKDAVALNVAFLGGPLGAVERTQVAALKTDVDDFAVKGREVYWLCRKRQSESTFSYARLEKQLKVAATFRGIRTVQTLAERLAAQASR